MAYLDVNLVVCCCKDNVYDKGAFTERGVTMEDININNPLFLFQLVDRFLTLARAVPRAMVIHSYHSCLACAQVLISALLISYYGFDALAAKAWACMVRPNSVVSGSERLRFVDLREPGLAPLGPIVDSTLPRFEK